MAYTAITTPEVTTGEPVSSTVMTKVKDNFIDHESRLQELEGGVTSSPPPIEFFVRGGVGVSYAIVGYEKKTINFNLRITGVRLYIDKAGASGTAQIDLLYKRGGGSFTSVLSTKPSVAAAAGDDAVSSNAVIDTDEDDLEAGDILRLDVNTFQVNGVNMWVRIDYERT